MTELAAAATALIHPKPPQILLPTEALEEINHWVLSLGNNSAGTGQVARLRVHIIIRITNLRQRLQSG